jgi:hypothetical protein
MWSPWSELATLFLTVLTILGVGWSQAKRMGEYEEKLNQVFSKVDIHDALLTLHTAQLADAVGVSRVVAERLEHIKEGQKEIHDMILKHIVKDC